MNRNYFSKNEKKHDRTISNENTGDGWTIIFKNTFCRSSTLLRTYETKRVSVCHRPFRVRNTKNDIIFSSIAKKCQEALALLRCFTNLCFFFHKPAAGRARKNYYSLATQTTTTDRCQISI